MILEQPAASNATDAPILGTIRVRFPKGNTLPRILAKLLLIGYLSLVTSSAALAQSVDVKDGKVTGPGFVITLPPGVTPDVAATTESSHGFYLSLPIRASDAQTRPPLTRTYRYIAFDTKWDLGDMPSLQAAVDSITHNLSSTIPSYVANSGEVTIDGTFPARLGTLPARRIVLKYTNNGRKPAIRQVVVAYNARKDASAVVYFLVLNTTEQNFQDDLGVFGKILAGFKVTGQ